MDNWLNLTLIIILLLLSAFFASSETSLFTLDEMKLKRMPHKKDIRRIKILLQNTSLLMITLLAVNTIVNTAVAALLEKQLGFENIIYSTLAVTLIILFFGEITPKTIAVMRGESLARFNSRLLYPVFIFISPVSRFIAGFTDTLMDFLKKIHKKEAGELDKERLSAILSIVSREDIFDKDEKRLIENIIHFTEREVWNIMTPRTKVFSVDKNTPIKEVIRLAKRMKVSKIPVYEKTDDNLTGVIYLKDIFQYVLNPEKAEGKKAADIMGAMYFVPETKRLSEMLDDFKKKKIRVAAVVDEYGSAMGIVTIADVLGEIVGELMDESFTVDKKIIRLSKDRYLVSGELGLDDFNTYFETELKSRDYETLAGFFIESAGDIPDVNFSLDIENYAISVREKSDKQIELFVVERK